MQSHALSFFHLSAPDLLLGMDSDPARRNIAGLLEEHPDALRDGIALRKFGQQVIERLGKERIHPSWIVPGGVNAPLDPQAREKTLAELPGAIAIVKRTLALWKATVAGFPDEIEAFSNFPTMYCGLVGPDGSLRLYDGNLRFVGSDGAIVADQVRPEDYAAHIGEASLPDSYLKAPYYRPVGYPGRHLPGRPAGAPQRRRPLRDAGGRRRARGVPRALRPDRPERLPLPLRAPHRGHCTRSSACSSCSTIRPSSARRSGPTRASTRTEGTGIIEAPRGTLIHHYKVDDNGAITWANLIVATGHNNLAMSRGVLQVAKRFVDGNKIQEGALNRVSALIRAYDPCLSCSTHAIGLAPVVVELRGSDGRLLDEVGTG